MNKIRLLLYNHWVLLFIALSIVLSFAIHFESVQQSDFGIYLRCGMHLGDFGLENAFQECQSAYMKTNNIFIQRSVATSWHIGLLKLSYLGIKLFNFVLSILCWLILIYFFPKNFKKTALGLTAIVYFLYPERLFSLLIVSPDHVALILLTLWLGLVPLCFPKKRHITYSVATIALLVVLLHATDMSRHIGILLTLTIGFLFIVDLLKRRWRFCILHASLLLFSIFNPFKLIIPSIYNSQYDIPIEKALAAIDFSTLQDSTAAYRWNQHEWYAIPNEHQKEYCWERFSSELKNNFILFPRYFLKKLILLFGGNGYYTFTLDSTNQDSFNPDSELIVSKSNVPHSNELIILFRIITMIVFLIAIIGTKRAWIQHEMRGFVAFFYIFILVICGSSEAQPRYSLLLLPSMVILCGHGYIEMVHFFRKSLNFNVFKKSYVYILSTSIVFVFILTLPFFITKDIRPPVIFAESVSECSDGEVEFTSYRTAKLFIKNGKKCGAFRWTLNSRTKDFILGPLETTIPYSNTANLTDSITTLSDNTHTLRATTHASGYNYFRTNEYKKYVYIRFKTKDLCKIQTGCGVIITSNNFY